MTATTLNRALERMGFNDKGSIGFAAHGFRATASTMLNEAGYRPAVIERQLAPPSRPADELLCRLHAEILVPAAHLLDAGVEHHEVVDQFEESRFLAHLQQVAVQQVRLAGMGAAVFHPLESYFSGVSMVA